MSDSDSSGAAALADSRKDSLWKRLRGRFARKGEIGLRESLEGALETHGAQNPG